MSLRVLVVDDDEACRYLLERELKAAGHEPVLHHDWTGVIDLLEGSETIDALVTDLRLPAGTPNGVSLAQMAKKRRPELKIVFITAFADLMAEAPERLGPVFFKGNGFKPVIGAIGA